MAETGLNGPWEAVLKRLIHMPGRVLAAMQQATLENAVGLVGETKTYIIEQRGPAPKLHPYTLAQRTVGRGEGEPKRLIDHGDLVGAITYLMSADRLSARVGIPDAVRNDDGMSIGVIATIQTEGCTIEVTDKMRAYLHANGLHLRKDTTHIVIPPYPFLQPAFEAYREKMKDRYRERFLAAFKGGE